MKFRFAGESHVGCEYTHNEDAIGWSVPQNFWLVADGMGGYESGEIASAVAKRTALRLISDCDDLKKLIIDVHHEVVDEATKRGNQGPMGTTLTVLRITGRTCKVAWVGDSRAWLWRKGKLGQINRDHTELQEMIDAGKLKREEVYSHPKANVLLQGLGRGNPNPEQVEIRLKSRDWVLLSTDGLHDKVPEAQIAAVLADAEHPAAATQKLVKAALDAETDDNVSVIVIACPEFEPEGLVERLGNVFRQSRGRTTSEHE